MAKTLLSTFEGGVSWCYLSHFQCFGVKLGVIQTTRPPPPNWTGLDWTGGGVGDTGYRIQIEAASTAVVKAETVSQSNIRQQSLKLSHVIPRQRRCVCTQETSGTARYPPTNKKTRPQSQCLSRRGTSMSGADAKWSKYRPNCFGRRRRHAHYSVSVHVRLLLRRWLGQQAVGRRRRRRPRRTVKRRRRRQAREKTRLRRSYVLNSVKKKTRKLPNLLHSTRN